MLKQSDCATGGEELSLPTNKKTPGQFPPRRCACDAMNLSLLTQPCGVRPSCLRPRLFRLAGSPIAGHERGRGRLAPPQVVRRPNCRGPEAARSTAGEGCRPSRPPCAACRPATGVARSRKAPAPSAAASRRPSSSARFQSLPLLPGEPVPAPVPDGAERLEFPW